MKNNRNIEKRKGGLTDWIKMNEENLYVDFMKQVNRDSLNTPKNKGLQRAYFTTDTTNYLGKFTHLVRKSSDSIEVLYFYRVTNKVDSPELKILLTVNYNKRYAIALDTVLNSSIQTKYFIVEKYEQPDNLPDIYRFENGDISVKNIRVEILKSKSPHVVIFYVQGKKNIPLLLEIQGNFHRSLLGEELLLKKVESVKYEFVDSLPPYLLSIYDARKFLKSEK